MKIAEEEGEAGHHRLIVLLGPILFYFMLLAFGIIFIILTIDLAEGATQDLYLTPSSNCTAQEHYRNRGMCSLVRTIGNSTLCPDDLDLQLTVANQTLHTWLIVITVGIWVTMACGVIVHGATFGKNQARKSKEGSSMDNFGIDETEFKMATYMDTVGLVVLSLITLAIVIVTAHASDTYDESLSCMNNSTGVPQPLFSDSFSDTSAHQLLSNGRPLIIALSWCLYIAAYAALLNMEISPYRQGLKKYAAAAPAAPEYQPTSQHDDDDDDNNDHDKSGGGDNVADSKMVHDALNKHGYPTSPPMNPHFNKKLSTQDRRNSIFADAAKGLLWNGGGENYV